MLSDIAEWRSAGIRYDVLNKTMPVSAGRSG
jgi:hypothetical protein